MMHAHPDSPYQKDYSGTTDAAYATHAGKLRDGIVNDGGITLPATSADIAKGSSSLPVGPSAPKWFGVGHARDFRPGAAEARVPEKNYNLSAGQFNAHDALGEVLSAEHHNIERGKQGVPPISLGGWSESNSDGSQSAVVDHTSVYKSENRARRATAERGERAYFDAKNMVSKDSEGREVA